MSDPAQPHDRFFKALTDDPRLAGTLIRERLPEDVVAVLSDDPPEPLDGSFIDEDLRGSQSDRLFRLHTAAGDDFLLYVLVEHKSAPDPGLPLQLLGYMLRIWQRHADRTLPPILPLVVYHGARTWAAPTSFRDLIAAGEAVRRHHLDFTYTLADLGRIDDARLSRMATLRAGLLALKYALRETDPWPVLLAILADLPEDDPIIRPMLLYLLSVYRDVDRPMLIRAIEHTKPQGDDSMLSIAAREWLAEGKAEGKAEMLHRLLVRRFGPLPSEVEDRIRGADNDMLDRWGDRLLDARGVDEVFRDDRSH